MYETHIINYGDVIKPPLAVFQFETELPLRARVHVIVITSV